MSFLQSFKVGYSDDWQWKSVILFLKVFQGILLDFSEYLFSFIFFIQWKINVFDVVFDCLVVVFWQIVNFFIKYKEFQILLVKLFQVLTRSFKVKSKIMMREIIWKFIYFSPFSNKADQIFIDKKEFFVVIIKHHFLSFNQNMRRSS